MLEYPVEIKDTDFKDTTVTVEQPRITLNVERAVFDLPSKNTTDRTSCEIVELWIESLTTKKSCKKSFDAYQTIPSATDQVNRFHFVPLLEDLKVNWKFKNYKYIKSAELELFRNDSGNAQKLWTKKIIWEVGKCPEEGNTPFNGDLSDTISLKQAKDAKEVTITNLSREEDFPYKCLSVEPSPYMLKLTITEATVDKAKHIRWLFLDVLVHSIEMDWGAETLLPQDRPDILEDAKHPGYKAKVLGYEATIIDDLKKANPQPDTANVVHKVKLDSNLFATTAAKGQPNEESSKTTDYEEYKALWGDGPRIPLLAKVHLLKSDDGSTKDNSGAPEQIRVAKALGNSQVLWDWADDAPNRWKEPLNAGATNKTEAFLDIAHKKNRPSLPDNSCNCPADLGGKRGDDNAPVFPKQDSLAPFTYKVTPSATRQWASSSSFGKDDNQNPTNISAAIFQPARQAGDTYAVVAYMDFVQTPLSQAKIQTVSALQSKPAKFKVFRRVKVNYLVRGSDAQLGCSPAQLQPIMEQFFLKEVDMMLDVVRTPVDNNIYIQALADAIDQVEQEDITLRSFDNLPLLFRNLIDMNPPDGSPAICLHPQKVFLDNLQQQFQSSKLRVMYDRTKKPPKNNAVTGKTSGAKGQLITVDAYNPDEKGLSNVDKDFRYLVLLPGGGPDFAASENIESRTGENNAKQTNAVTVEKTKSCWGHSITPEEDTSKAYNEAINVIINGVSTIVRYDKSFVSRKLKDELSNREKERLRAAIRTAGENQNESQPMEIKLRGRIHSVKAQNKRGRGVSEDQIEDNAAERMKNLTEFIEAQFKEFVIADRKAVYQRFITQVIAPDAWKEIQADRFKALCTKDIVSKLFVPIILNYISLSNPNAEGALLMHVPGRTNASSLPEFKDKEEYKDLRVTGGFYPDGTLKRSSGVVFLSTIPPENGKKIPQKTIDLTISHEVAHSLFLPHPNSSIAGGPATPNSVPGVHIGGDGKDHTTDKSVAYPGDNCIMNYDLDSSHFCGMCMLRLRGWKWESFKGIPIPEEYEYKIDLVMDDVDTLFADPATPRGKMERLQALGLFNHPLKHPKANECLQYSMEHAKQLGILPGTDVAPLKTLISQFLMQGGVRPNPGQFAKMRLPKNNILYSQGMLKILFPEDFSQYGTDDEKAEQAYSEKFMLGADPYAVDQLFFKDNPSLGKIPFKVTVKKRLKNSGQDWNLADNAPNVSVYFKLITPDPLTPYAANLNPPATPLAGGNSYYNQIIAAPIAATPGVNLKVILDKGGAAPTDPDAKNASATVGGKRVGKGKANVFCGTREEGFGDISEGTKTGHEFTARVISDQTGTARICFNPSSIGGDAYKLRVYVGPPTQEKQGQPLGDDAVETGTMVRWRTSRISHYINMPPPASSAELPAELRARAANECNHNNGSALGAQAGRICTDCLMRYGNMPAVDLKNSLSLEMAKAYCELIIEPAAEAPVAFNTIKDKFLDELDDLLATYPRLNSLYWVRNHEHSITVDRFNYQLLPQHSTGDKVFSAILPYFQGNVKVNDLASIVSKKTDGKKLAILSVGELVNGKVGEDILSETTGDGNLTDLNKVAGGVKADVDYDTGLLVVEFNQPQTGKQFSAKYAPANLLDFRKLLYFPPKSPYLFNLRMPSDYNAQIGDDIMPMYAPTDLAKGRARPDFHFKYIDNRDFGAVKTLLMTALGSAVSKYTAAPSGPYCPGLIFIRALALDTYEGVWSDGTQEGKAVGNIIYVFGGDGAPPACGLAPLTLHETSHGLYMFHAPGGGAKPVKAERHDTDYTCVMSYAANQGDYCGKCNASIRGMKIT